MKSIRLLLCALPLALLLLVLSLREDGAASSTKVLPAASAAQTEVVDASAAFFSKAPEAFDDWIEAYRNDPQESALVEGIALAKKRRAVLKKLIAVDPERALESAIWPEMRAHLPEAITEQLETPFSTAAEFEKVASCYLGGLEQPEGVAAEVNFISFNEERYQAFTFGRRAELLTKDRISAVGITIDGVAALSPNPVRAVSDDGLSVEAFGEIKQFSQKSELGEYVAALLSDESLAGPGEPREVAESPWTEGTKRILYLRVRFADDDPAYEPITLAAVQSDQDDVAEHYRISSYGKLNVSTVFPDTITLPENKSRYVNQGLGKLMDDARALAITMGQAQGVDWDYRNYDLCTVMSDRGIGSYAGIAQVGGRESHFQRGFTSLRTAAHEYGHNLGLSHAYYNLTSDLSPRGETPVNGLRFVEYGHRFSLMSAQGGSDFENPTVPHFTVHEKRKLDWLTDADTAQVTQQDQTGTFRLFQNDHEDASGIRAITLPSGGVLPTYWLSYRTAWNQANRGTENEFLSNGIIFNWTNGLGRRSTLLDMTPFSNQGLSTGAGFALDNSDKWDAPLMIGRTYTDPESQVSVTPMARGGSAPDEYIDVYVHLGPKETLNLIEERTLGRALIPNPSSPTQPEWTSAAFDDSSWFLAGSTGAGFDFEPTYQPLIGLSVFSMWQRNASSYLRVPFEIDAGVDLAKLKSLNLGMRYDDGFVAYINGVKVAEANAPASPTWNSNATSSHPDEEALISENFNANAALGALVSGRNVLSIHGLNLNSLDQDFLIQPTLTATARVPENSAPIVSLAANKLEVAVNENVTFTTTASDADGDILAYAWDFGIDSTFAPEGLNDPLAVRRWSAPGLYIVTLTCSDRKGGVARARVMVKVGAPANDGVIRGQVWRGGQAVAGARVFVEGSDQQSITLDDGSYIIAGLSKTIGTSLGAMLDGEVFQASVPMPQRPNPEALGVDFFAHGSLATSVQGPSLTISPSTATVAVGQAVPLKARIWDRSLAEDLLIPLGDTWSFLDTGVFPGSQWTQVGFDDSRWRSGTAELGYGDSQETRISFGASSTSKHVTTWFRRSFVGSNIAEISRLKLSVKRDDGLRVFLNGIEIARDNLSTGTVSSGTLASNDVVASEEETLLHFNVDPSLLIEGDNLIAVEIHQASRRSNDLSFDLELSAARNLSEITPTWTVTPLGGSVSRQGVFTATSKGAFTVTGTSGGLSAEATIFAGVSEGTVIIEPAQNEVNIVALDDFIWENGSVNARFEVRRTGNTTTALKVPLVIAGSANAGTDFLNRRATVTFPIGSALRTFRLTLINDDQYEGHEQISASLGSNGKFIAGTNTEAIVVILDDENLIQNQVISGGDLEVFQNQQISLLGSISAEVQFIAAGNYWKFNDSGVAAGRGWTTRTFDDSSWGQGVAKFGYGNDDDTTSVRYGGMRRNKYPTTYFRRLFHLDDPADFSGLTARVLVDDGAVIYVNGIESQRINMPTGTIGFSTLAAKSVGGRDESAFFEFDLDPATLVAGQNIITVEVHQASRSSSDLGFDLELKGTSANLSNRENVSWSQLAGPGIANFTDQSDPSTLVDFPQAGTYLLRLQGQSSGTFDDLTVIVKATQNYQNWVIPFTSSSTTPPLDDPSPLADSDSDGLANLLEYAFGGDPTVASAGLSPTLTGDPTAPNDLIFSYRRLSEIETGDGNGSTGEGYLIYGITYTVQVSNTLTDWTTASDIMTIQNNVAPIDNGDGTETIQLRLSPQAGDNSFWSVRLCIENP